MRAKTFLFVYGTLMRGCKSELGRQQRKRLSMESIYVGPACVEGRLYDLGGYPGLKLNLEISTEAEPGSDVSRRAWKVGGNIVGGELVRLLNERISFPWLDAYEGVYLGANDSGSDNRGGYSREIAEVQLDIGQRVKASMYVFSGPEMRFRQIFDGCWLRFSRRSKT